MNEPERLELEALKQEHLRLSRDLTALAVRIRLLETRGLQPQQVRQRTTQITPAGPIPAVQARLAVPPPIPVPTALPPAATKPPASPPVAVQGAIASVGTASGQGALEIPPGKPAGAAAGNGERSFEMRLGTYWFVRIGIVMVLTAMVFFGNFAYQNFVAKLGAGGKVVLMYFGSSLLLAAGAWWQRKAARETLRNYAQVLFAGGLAAVYFTTYAAHHFENLRVIPSATADGLLLLAWAGFMAWTADRRKSEVLALFAVGLAYYTSIITRAGHFTLYSNLLLSLAAVFFLVRNRWAALSFGSLGASYAAYAFWRFFDGANWNWASPEAGLWAGVYFLGAYWLVFTCAVLLSRDQRLEGANRATFLTLNNAAFFTLFILTMLQVRSGGFWKVCIIYGAVLLALAEVARRQLASETLAKNLYLSQGLLLVTVGLIARFSGMHLALLLAVESFMLLLLGRVRCSAVLRAGAWICGALALGFAIDDMRDFDRPGLYLGLGVAAVMIGNAVQAARAGNHDTDIVRAEPLFFGVVSLVALLVTTWHNCERVELSHVLALEGVLLTGSLYLVRVRELAFAGQVAVALGYLSWIANALAMAVTTAWQALLVVALAAGLVHWWQRQRQIRLSGIAACAWQSLHAVGLVVVLLTWLWPKFGPSTWIAMSCLMAVGLTVYATVTRGWLIGAWGQLFLMAGVGAFASGLLQGHPEWYWAAGPVIALSLLSLGTDRWFAARPADRLEPRRTLLAISRVYRWVALALALAWVEEYIPPREQVWVQTLAGTAFFLVAGLRRSPEPLLFSAVFFIAALGAFWLPSLRDGGVYAPDALSFVMLLALQQIAARYPDRFTLPRQIHHAAVLVSGLTLWRFLSVWVMESASGFYLTASWSALALAMFGAGLALRERMYRWLGLAVLACALGRVMVFDVWKLQTLYRILSFMALGVVLLVLGFFYSKYQEKIRHWL